MTNNIDEVMKNKQVKAIVEEGRELILNLFYMPHEVTEKEAKEYEDWLTTKLQEVDKKGYERGMNEAVDLSDKIEMEAPHSEFDEWRAFKRFRNTLREKIKSLKNK